MCTVLFICSLSVFSALNCKNVKTSNVFLQLRTQEALLRLRTETFTASSGAREGVQDVAVLVTDGRSNVHQQMTAHRAAELRQSGVTIHVIALNDADAGEARAIAGSTGLVQLVHDEQQAHAAVDFIADRLCQRP